jgi:RimJ/RimL family protein N-acetyltransferase
VVIVPDRPLTAGRFVLRPWEPEDAKWYVAARDEEVYRWTTEPRDLTADVLRAVIVRNRRAPAWVGLAITDGATGQIIGNLSLSPDPTTADTAEVAYWLAPEGRGRGAATEAVRAVCAWAFATTTVARIRLGTHPDNHASQAVARRAGFAFQRFDGTRFLFELRRE